MRTKSERDSEEVEWVEMRKILLARGESTTEHHRKKECEKDKKITDFEMGKERTFNEDKEGITWESRE